MDGHGMDGTFDTVYWEAPTTSTEQLESISNALNATLDPRVSNDVRKQAFDYLEGVKNQLDAPHCGFTLAENWDQSDAVRYYGLQLLEHAVKYKWREYRQEQTDQLRTWIKCLAGSIRRQDTQFLRNKIAQLWVEVAKRCWGEDWMDMDRLLVNLWERPMSEKGTVNKLLVLYILETLSEDITNDEDAAAGLRADILGPALNEIMMPEGTYNEFAATRGERQEVRSGPDGWLHRILSFFAECVKYSREEDATEIVQSMGFCAIKALHTLRPTMSWINLKAAAEVNAVDSLFLPFRTDRLLLQTAATEVLYVLLGRPNGPSYHETWVWLMQEALHPDRIAMIRRIFDNMSTDSGDDNGQYTLLKKLSETVSLLADAVAHHVELARTNINLPAFFDLLILILRNDSLVVSIPILHSWTKLMAARDSAINDIVFQALGTLLQTCSERLMRYESLPEDDSSRTLQWLLEDFETQPERHAFLGNYRRYCGSVIQTIASTRPLEALSYVLGQMREFLETGPYTGGRGFDSSRYSKTDLAVLKFDAQFQTVSSALKGYSSWVANLAAMTPEDEGYAQAQHDNGSAVDSLQQWSYTIINIHMDDPEVAAQVLQTLVLVLRTIKPEPGFVLHIVQHLLTMRLYDNPEHVTFSDAVKAFEGLRVVELQKLALAFATELSEVYHELEPRIGVLAEKHNDDPRLAWGYKAFLFMIIHRASGLGHQARLNRLQQMLKPVYEGWQNRGLHNSVSSLPTFCDALGMDDLPAFYKAYGFDRSSDWASLQLDDAGQARQASIKVRNDELPLRMTKSMLAATTEKLRPDSNEFENACTLWTNVIPIVLPNLLQMIRYAQAFYNMASWSHLPDELQMVVKRTLQDRFWQSGISSESRDEFYARISGSRTSFEGFASVVRGTMRNVREQGYHIIYLMTKFEEQFYGLLDLAEPLAEALFADAGALSANHLHPLINLTTGLVSRCPPHHRTRFLPPLLTQLFTKLDAKVSSEWEAIGQASQQNASEDDDLGDEMRMESVLRQLTYSMVSFVPFLLEFDGQRHGQHQANGHASQPKFALSELVLSDPSVLEPMLLFCTHALRMRDTRCCVLICKVFRSIIPLFQSAEAPAPQVREFISTDVLKACITSLNEPYFADMQKDLAALIAQIILLYALKTGTVRDVLLSLPSMPTAKVDKALEKICGKGLSDRQQRATVLDLLEDVRGVSIYESGRITPKKGVKKGVQRQYMEMEPEPIPANGDADVAGLDGVAALFGGS